jgi:hypothetical protein
VAAAEMDENDHTRATSDELALVLNKLEELRAQLVTALGRQSASLTVLRKAVDEADKASELVQNLRREIDAREKQLNKRGGKQTSPRTGLLDALNLPHAAYAGRS